MVKATGATPADLVLTVDGSQPLTAASVSAIAQICDAAEDSGSHSAVTVHVTGTPAENWAADLTVALVSRWERALRRLERLPATTVAVAEGECGGPALEVLLATDYRIATSGTRLVVPVGAGTTWPGMAVFRLAHQSSGTGAIRRAVLFGTPIDAADALTLHLLDHLTDDVPGALAAAAGIIGSVSGPELAIRRRLLLEARTSEFEEALGAHLAACDRMLRRAEATAAR
jgi:isomerase DpgB